MREALRSYRQMVYLDDLNDAEFVLFSDEVAGQLENSYPVYMEFVQMQGVDDTVDMVVVSTIVDELNADARNMRHIYPYNYLVAIIGKTKCDGIQNQMRLFGGRVSPKRKATKISHTHTKKHRSNGF